MDRSERVALSPYNRETSARDSVRVADCTLRDGEQHAGLVIAKDRKVKIAKLLIELGVYEIEAGSPAVSSDDRDAVAEIAELGGARVSALAIARESAIDEVADTGVWGVRISFPAGTRQLKHKLKMTESEYLRRALEISSYAKTKGLYVVFSPYDTTRADEGFLRRTLGPIAASGAIDRIRMVDTAGAATPSAIDYLVRLLLEVGGGVPIEVHVHDDFGLATANTIAGVRAGAEYVSTSMNGLGERSGNASTEEVVAALELLHGVGSGIRLERLFDIAAAVSRLVGVPIPVSTPIIGANSFAHESGLVTAGVLEDPFTAEAYDPALVGQARQIVHGKKSGTKAIAWWLRANGFPDDEVTTAAMLAEVKTRALLLERALQDAELIALAQRISSRPDG